MIKIAICEDERMQQELLKEYLDKLLLEIDYNYEIQIFNSGEDLFNNYPKDIDIFLLDIQMDKLNGMDVARQIRDIDNQNVEIIFITSIVDYIQEGYEVRAYRYILKPIKFDDLKKHIVSCIYTIMKNKESNLIISSKGELYKINVSDITYIEIQKKDMIIHTINKDYDVKMSMENVDKKLKEYSFFRCHKSFLVNLNYIEKIRQYVAILENDEEVPVSRHRFKDFKVKFLSHLGDII